MRLHWHVGDVIRKLRQAKRLNQTKLGVAANPDEPMDKGTISRLEVGGEDAVTTDTLKRVARALGYSLADLYAAVPMSADVSEVKDILPPKGRRQSESSFRTPVARDHPSRKGHRRR